MCNINWESQFLINFSWLFFFNIHLKLAWFILLLTRLLTCPFRYKYENDRVIDAAASDASSPLPYQVYGSQRTGKDVSMKGTYNQLLERQVWLLNIFYFFKKVYYSYYLFGLTSHMMLYYCFHFHRSFAKKQML